MYPQEGSVVLLMVSPVFVVGFFYHLKKRLAPNRFWLRSQGVLAAIWHLWVRPRASHFELDVRSRLDYIR